VTKRRDIPEHVAALLRPYMAHGDTPADAAFVALMGRRYVKTFNEFLALDGVTRLVTYVCNEDSTTLGAVVASPAGPLLLTAAYRVRPGQRSDDYVRDGICWAPHVSFVADIVAGLDALNEPVWMPCHRCADSRKVLATADLLEQVEGARRSKPRRVAVARPLDP
jgi:hypothetical protein